MQERSIQDRWHKQAIIYMMGDVGEVKYSTYGTNRRWWCKGQYRTDDTNRPLSIGCVVQERSLQDGLSNRPLSTGWVVLERSIQNGLHRLLSTGSVVLERSMHHRLHKETIMSMMGGVGEVNTVRMTQTAHYLQDEWCKRGH